MARQKAAHLEDAFEQLPKQDQYILAQVVGGCRLRDVALAFGVSVSTIGGRVHRARRRLRRQIDAAMTEGDQPMPCTDAADPSSGGLFAPTPA